MIADKRVGDRKPRRTDSSPYAGRPLQITESGIESLGELTVRRTFSVHRASKPTPFPILPVRYQTCFDRVIEHVVHYAIIFACTNDMVVTFVFPELAKATELKIGLARCVAFEGMHDDSY